MITLLSHQPINFAYSLNTCEALSANCLQYQTSDTAMLQFKNSQDDCWFLVGIRPTGSILPPTEINKDHYVVSGDFVTVTINFAALGLTDGCYEVVLYEVCTDADNNLITNGTFATDLTGWIAQAGLTLDVDSHTTDSVTLIATGGSGSYTYSIDGVTYQAGTTFSGLSANTLYTFHVKDSNNIITSTTFIIIDCTSFGCTEFDYTTYKESIFLDCLEYDSLCKYPSTISGTNSITITQSMSSLAGFGTGTTIAVLDSTGYDGLYEILSSSLTGFGNHTLVVVLTTSPFDIADVGDPLTLVI